MNGKYEPPVIRKLQGGLMNKFGRGPSCSRKVCREIDGVAIEDLVGASARRFMSFRNARSGNSIAICTTPSRAAIPT